MVSSEGMGAVLHTHTLIYIHVILLYTCIYIHAYTYVYYIYTHMLSSQGLSTEVLKF